MPRRLIEQAAGLGQAFVEDPGTTGTMIHSDLHYANVLAGDREAWLAIDPSPLSGDPHYEVAPLLWHRWEGISSSGNVREAIRRRFFAVVEAAGLDEDRARDWVIVRALHLAAQRIIGPQGRDEIRDWVTRCISVAKAVQG